MVSSAKLLPPHVREAQRGDLGRLLEILSQSPEAAQWPPAVCRRALDLDTPETCLVADLAGQPAGFLVYQALAEDECEILNLAVDSSSRRRGVGRALLRQLALRKPGDIFLELRASNRGALQFYRRMGFDQVGRRPGYYSRPPEDALLMRLMRKGPSRGQRDRT